MDTLTPTYLVIDRHTGKPVGKPYKSKPKARARVDQLDNAYGAYRYSLREAATGRVTL